MILNRMEIAEGARYRHRWTGALVRIKQVRRDGSVMWNALDDYKIEGHTWGVMEPLGFVNEFEQIGGDYRLMGKVS